MSCVRRARLRDLGNVGHDALDRGVSRGHQALDVGGGDLPVAHLDRPGRWHRAGLAAPPLMLLAVCRLAAGVAAEPGIRPRPRRQYPIAAAASSDWLRHG